MHSLRTRFNVLGGDGLFTLALSNLIIILSGGLTLLWPLRQVLQTARQTGTTTDDDLMLVVLGKALENGCVSFEYATRLDRALTNYRQQSRPILLVGGRADEHNSSEAACGRDYLRGKGVNERYLLLEDTSMHTLENLHRARQIILHHNCDGRFALITSRYHLKRSEVIAQGLGLQPQLCAAEESFHLPLTRLPRLLLEGFYIHWYHTGSLWSQLTGNRKSLARIR